MYLLFIQRAMEFKSSRRYPGNREGWCQTLFLVLTCCFRNQKQSLTPRTPMYVSSAMSPWPGFLPADWLPLEAHERQCHQGSDTW